MTGELLDHARTLLARPDAATAGLWPRAAAVLGRQALEEALRYHTGLDDCSVRVQLLCLSERVDEEFALRVAHAWQMLSRACHHHQYELAPTAEELAEWLSVATEFAVR